LRKTERFPPITDLDPDQIAHPAPLPTGRRVCPPVNELTYFTSSPVQKFTKKLNLYNSVLPSFSRDRRLYPSSEPGSNTAARRKKMEEAR